MIDVTAHWIKSYEGRLVNLAYVQTLEIKKVGTIAAPDFTITARIGDKENIVLSRSNREETVKAIYQKISVLLIKDVSLDLEDSTQTAQSGPLSRSQVANGPARY